MKNIYVCIIFTLPILAFAQSPCDQTQITLESQADVDSFPSRFCSTVCSLTISGNDITNLDSLYVLQKAGRLVIQFNPALTSIAGLSNLSSIENSCTSAGLEISGNNLLPDLDGLSGLTSIAGSVTISSNTMLGNIDGLSNLGNISSEQFSGITIESNASLDNVDGLHGLSTIGTSLSILRNPALRDIEGISTVTRVHGSLEITGNDALTSLNGLRNVTWLDAFLTISENPLLPDLQGLQNINHVGQWNVAGMSVTVSANERLTSLNGLQGLDTIPGTLTIDANESLRNLNGLSSLRSMTLPGGGSSYNAGIHISNNSSLTDISGIAGLQRIEYARACYFEIISNGSLTTIDSLGLTGVAGNIGGSVTISGNASLVNIDGLSSLGVVSGGLSAGVSITGNTALQNVDGLSGLSTISSARSASLTITDNTTLDRFCGLYTLFNAKGIGCGSPGCYNPSMVTIEGNERNPTPEEIEAEGPCDATIVQPTNISFTQVTSDGMRVRFNKAASFVSGYLVLMRAYGPSAPEFVPQDGSAYHVGQVIGGSSIVVSVNSDTTLVVSGLVPSTPYYFDVFSWKTSENGNDYLTVSPLQGSQSTTAETASASNLSFTDVTSESMTVMMDDVAPGNYIALMKAFGSPSPNDVPADGSEYHVGNTIGSSTIVVNIGDGSAFTVNGLMPDVTYHFDIYSYDPSTFTYAPGPAKGSQSTSAESGNLRAYPNPFDVTTTIPFVVQQEEESVHVAIYDAMGQEVNVLTSGNFETGRHETSWDGYDKHGRRVTAGVYIYSVKSDRGVVTGRVSVR